MSTTKPKPPATSRPVAKPKAMSSKLLTMKFMQRSAATSRTDTLAVREALVQENAKRDAALQARERNSSATSSGDAETRWELSYVNKIDGSRSARVVDWGYGEVVSSKENEDDDDDEEDEDEEDEKKEEGEGRKSGRMVFGKFRSKADPPKTEEKDTDSEAEAPRRKNVSLRGLTSISNSGPPPETMVCRGCGGKGHTQAKCPQAKCYACDGKGHMAKDCPRAPKGKKRQPIGYSSGARDDVKKRRSGNY